MPKLGRRSEVTELDYQKSQALLTRDAPFGTEDTPDLKEKIIGGRYVSVLERPYGQNAPRYEKLSLVSDKPNHVDPRALTNFSRRYNKPYQESHSYPSSPQQQYSNRGYRNSEDPFHKSQVVGRPTNTISKRPDSKDISSRYPTLPPIEENRLRNNQISTVFEPEAWTRQYRPSDDKENHAGRPRGYGSREEERAGGFRPLYNPRGSGDAYGSRYSEPDLRRATEAPLSNEDFVKELAGMLPQNVFLPDRPLVISHPDEMRLLSVIADELQHFSPLKLRDIYLDIANTADKNLSGYCQYQDLYYSMSRHMMSMPGDLLQVTAAMFVSHDRLDRQVNYEKFLSFVGMALKQANSNRPAGVSGRPKTPVEQQVDNYFADSEQAKLVSMVEQQLRENEHVINFSQLENELSIADRLGKGALDLRTVMDVCYQLNIPLQSSVLHRVLQRCRVNPYEDRYSWRAFVEFLTKAQPGRIGSEPVRLKPPPPNSPPPRRSPPPASRAVSPLWRRNEQHQQQQQQQQSYDNRQSQNYNGYQQEEQGSRTEVISRMSQDIRQLERNYEDIKEKLKPRNDTPWFKNFMELANALYKQDERYDGDLPAEDVFRWTKMYNDTCNLDIEDYVISKALSDSTKSGKVNIHTFLTKLGNVANHDKIV